MSQSEAESVERTVPIPRAAFRALKAALLPWERFTEVERHKPDNLILYTPSGVKLRFVAERLEP